MAKARARTTARKVKDKWKAKQWYTIVAPAAFNKVAIAETPAEEPEKLIGRIATTTMQDLTGDFKLMHVKMDFQVEKFAGTTAETRYIGHSLTSDYVRRLVRRNHTKISCVFDVHTKDGAVLRVKPFAVTDRRAQSSQERELRNIMATVTQGVAQEQGLDSFLKEMLDGRLAAKLFKACKPIYPLRKVEINKSEVRTAPTITLEDVAPPATATTDGGPPAEPPVSPEEGGPEPAPEEPRPVEVTSGENA